MANKLPQIEYPNWNTGLSAYSTGLETGQALNKQNAMAAAGAAMARGDTAGAKNALYQHGQLEAGLKLDEHLRSQARQATADQLAKTQRFNATLGNLARLADTPEKWAAAISNAKAAGLDVDKFADFGTRDYVIAQAGMAGDIIEQTLKERQISAKAVKEAPSGYRWAEGGNLEAIPGGPATKMAGESAGRLALMRNAKADMDKAKEFFGADMGVTGRAAKVLNMGDAGEAERTVRSAIEATLRALTGAAAPDSEVARYESMFGPTIYDSPRTRMDKLRRLENFMNEAEATIMQGHGARPQATPQGQQQPSRLRFNPETGQLEQVQ